MRRIDISIRILSLKLSVLIIVQVPCTWKLFFSEVRDVLLIRLQVMVITLNSYPSASDMS